MLGAQAGVAPAGRDQLVIGRGRVLDPQLHDVDAAAQRRVQERVRSCVTDEVQASLRKALAAIVHGVSLAGPHR